LTAGAETVSEAERTAGCPAPRLKTRAALARAAVAAFLVTLQWLTFPIDATAQPPPPTLTAPVNDFANVIDSASKAELDRRIRAMQQKTGDVLVVATVNTFQPYADIDEYAVKMFENGGRGIGQKGKDNGVLIVLAIDDRRVRVEVGYDLEAFITDGFSGDVIRNVMNPAFKQGQYGPGVLAGATAIINRIAQGRGVQIPDVPQQPVRTHSEGPQIPFSLIIFIILIVLALSRGGGRRSRRPSSGVVCGVHRRG